ncbi:HAD family hydrolase [Pseudochryseolinea flava]|uniref:HAD family hydrolase n=1 Tax=Pseudochryseolinea flava TaxID=2059302 RepID=UPI00105797E0|nr:HAD family phosphatase [Pseudochryseolinea flava]
MGPNRQNTFVLKDSSVKNLIFDLGGVILDLSVDTTLQAVAKLSGLDKNEVVHHFVNAQGFMQFEKGLIDEHAFRDFVRETYNVTATDAQIDHAWNAMLLGLPIAKLHLLTRLMSTHQTFLLSNTNTIHLRFINENILPPVAGVTSLDGYFHKSYYSHLMKKRKPDAEIFQQVLEENNLKAEETLFLDDNKANIEGAAALGIKTLLVTHPDIVTEYFR